MIEGDFIRFEWDDSKASSNVGKHKVTFEEAEESFYNPYARIIDDPDHSDDEERFLLIGLSMSARVLTVSHCLRDEGPSCGSFRLARRRRASLDSIGGGVNEGRVRFQRQPAKPLRRPPS